MAFATMAEAWDYATRAARPGLPLAEMRQAFMAGGAAMAALLFDGAHTEDEVIRRLYQLVTECDAAHVAAELAAAPVAGRA